MVKESLVRGFMCSPRQYKVDNVIIEYPPYCGPCPLTKKGNPKQRWSKEDKIAVDKFYEAIMNETTEQYRVGGGCIPIV